MGVLAGTPQTAAGHNVNMNWNTVALNSSNCLQLRAEIDHDTAQHHRLYWAIKSMRGIRSDGGVSVSCDQREAGDLRRRGEFLRRPEGSGVYALCSATAGDGLGAPGYYHSFNDTEFGGNSSWRNHPPCSTGTYRAPTHGHVLNGGWYGAHTTSGEHFFAGGGR